MCLWQTVTVGWPYGARAETNSQMWAEFLMHAQVTKTWLVVLDGENNPMDALQQGSSNDPNKERLVARGRSGKESKHICHRWWNNLRINPSCQSVAPYCITSNSYLKRNEKLDINPCNVSETEMSESISYRVILHFGVPAKIKGLRLMAVTAACQQGAAGMSCFDFQKLVGQPHLYWVPLLKTSMQQRIEY